MVQRWEQVHNERKAKVSKLRAECQSHSRGKERGEPERSLSPMSRGLRSRFVG